QRRALKEMDDGVALQPDSLQTLIPRGAILLASAPFFPNPEFARPLLQKAVGDYEKVERIQSAAGSQRDVHARGELLGGLAVGYRLLGDRDNEAKYLSRIMTELPATPYAERAQTWLPH